MTPFRLPAILVVAACGAYDPGRAEEERLIVGGAFEAVCLATVSADRSPEAIMASRDPLPRFARARPSADDVARSVTAKWIAPYVGRATVTAGPRGSCTVAALDPRDPILLRADALARVAALEGPYTRTYGGVVNARGSTRDILCHQAMPDRARLVMLTTTAAPPSFFATTVSAEGTCQALTDEADIAAPD